MNSRETITYRRLLECSNILTINSSASCYLLEHWTLHALESYKACLRSVVADIIQHVYPAYYSSVVYMLEVSYEDLVSNTLCKELTYEHVNRIFDAVLKLCEETVQLFWNGRL